ncbi:tetratricopeptide repeat protein [candidate division KSB1 bacterium]|nr:tetratricopeptide repeat protein [candidate division KSB1 bacterium]
MKTKSVIIIVLLTGLFSSCAYYNTFYNAKKFYREAEKERKKRERTQVVELTPEEKAQQKKAGTYDRSAGNRAGATEMQSYQKSIEKASKVLEFFPESKYVDDALLLLGKCFYYRREYSKALRKFEEILQLYPDSDIISTARLLMAETYIGMEQYDDAERQLREIVGDDRFPKEIREEAGYELGGLYFEKENYEMAAERYNISAKRAQNKLFRALSLYRLGICHMSLKQYPEAIKAFRSAVGRSPNDDFKSQATYKLGESLSLNGDYKAAIKTFSSLLSKDFDEKRIPMIKLQLANNLNLSGDLRGAIKWYNNIIEDHKRTDASARSYFALGEVEEFINGDYNLAKENYDLVRAEFSNSLIAPMAKERADNIGELLTLRKDIARLEGRAVAEDSTGEKSDTEGLKEEKDDAPINLPLDGLWVNYTGRDRPPPKSLTDLTESDMERAALSKEKMTLMAATADSSADSTMTTQSAVLDSTALAKQKEEEEKKKFFELGQKHLALAQLLMFSFEKVDSAQFYFQKVLDTQQDTGLVASAYFSLGYIYRNYKADTLLSNSTMKDLIDLFPETPQAEGARKILGLPLYADKVDSAQMLFKNAENILLAENDLEEAFDLYDKVIVKFPDSPFAEKATFVKGWHYENTVKDKDKAFAFYEKLVEKYPKSTYAQAVQKKVAAVQKIKKEEEARQKAIADSIRQKTVADSLAKLPKPAPDSLNLTQGFPDSAGIGHSETPVDSLLQKVIGDSTMQSQPAAADELPRATTAETPQSTTAPVRGQNSPERLSNQESQPPPVEQTTRQQQPTPQQQQPTPAGQPPSALKPTAQDTLPNLQQTPASINEADTTIMNKKPEN